MGSLRENWEDAILEGRAFFQGIAWLTVMSGLGLCLTGWAQRNSTMFASGITAVVVAFFPRARPKWIFEITRTATMRMGWIEVPEEEKPLRTPDEIFGIRPSGLAPPRSPPPIPPDPHHLRASPPPDET